MGLTHKFKEANVTHVDTDMLNHRELCQPVGQRIRAQSTGLCCSLCLAFLLHSTLLDGELQARHTLSVNLSCVSIVYYFLAEFFKAGAM